MHSNITVDATSPNMECSPFLTRKRSSLNARVESFFFFINSPFPCTSSRQLRAAQKTQNDDILSVQNEKYISNLKDNFRNKTGKGLVNKALQYVPEMHLSLPSNILSEKVSNGS